MASTFNMGPFTPANFKGGDRVDAVPIFIDKLPFVLGGIAGDSLKFGRLVSIDPAGNTREFKLGIPAGNTPRGIVIMDPVIMAADPGMNDYYFEGRPAAIMVYGPFEVKNYLMAESAVPVLGSTIWAKDTTGELAFGAHDLASKAGFTKLNAHVLEVNQPNGVAIWLDYPIAAQTSTPADSIAGFAATIDDESATGSGTSADPYEVATGTIVTLNTTTPGTTIRYTTDASAPLDSSPIFPAEGLSITGTLRLRAVATKDGYNSTFVDIYYEVA